MRLTSLNADCLTVLATYLNGADFCRFIASSRVVCEAIRGARLVLEAAGNTRKLYSLHFWGIIEQQTRNNKQALAAVAPYFQGCFRLQRAVQPAGALAVQQLQQLLQQQAGQQQGIQQQQGQGAEQQLLLVVAAAALLGGWWQHTAQPGGGEAQQLAVHALQECLVQGPADAVAALVRDERCPAAARGFWGCIFLGIMMSVCIEVPNKAAARLVRSLLSIGQTGSLFPDASAIPVICPRTVPGNAEDPGRLECVWQQGVASQFVQYHAKQFVSAVLVLVRYMLQQTSVGHQDIKPSLRQMHHDMQTIMIKLHNDEQQAAVLAAQGVPGEAVWHLPMPGNLLPAAGMPQGTVLTSEQYRICKSAIGHQPREEQALVMVNALAGSGKSFTLRLLQLIHADKTILYAAYNKAVADDMTNSLKQACIALGWPITGSQPVNIDCRTTHQLASEARHFYGGLPGWELRSPNGVQIQLLLNELPFFLQRIQAWANQPGGGTGAASRGMGWLVKEILAAFCTSDDDTVMTKHLPLKRRHKGTLKYDGLTDVEAVTVGQQFWDAFRARSFRHCYFDHNWYLKAFVMEVVAQGRQLLASNGRHYDIILIDEAQDVNPVTYQLLVSQRCTVMLVGDKHQHIYSFNYASDALAAAAAEPYRRKRSFLLSHSFRLGPMVAEVANMALHQLGEHRQTMIAAGRGCAAVYAMMEEPMGPQPPAAAGNADGVAAANGNGAAAAAAPGGGGADAGANAAQADVGVDGHAAAAAGGEAVVHDPADTDAFQQWLQGHPPYQQLQLLDQPVPPTADTPPQLGAVRVPLMALKRPVMINANGLLVPDPDAAPEVVAEDPLFLAVPPLKPGADRRYPLMFLSRTNALWFQVAAALALATRPAGAAIRTILARPPRLFLMAAGSNNQANGDAQQQVVVGEFFTKVRNVARLRYLDAAQDPNNPFRTYGSYENMKQQVLAKSDETDLKAPIALCEMYGQQTEALLNAIHATQVSMRSEADFILGTCHRGKGQEEMYAQLADDFAELVSATPTPGEPDELNLVYVALSRAMLGLVCNRDLAELVTAQSRKELAVEVPPALPEDEEPQEQQVVCGRCYIRFDLTPVKADTLGHLVLRPLLGGHPDLGVPGPLCRTCIQETFLAQLMVGQANQQMQLG